MFKKISFLGLALAVLHCVVVFYIKNQSFEGSWGGFFLFLIDFPVSLLSFVPIGLNGWLFFYVFGSIWWYGIGFFICKKWSKGNTRGAYEN